MSDNFPVTKNAYQPTNHGSTACCEYYTYATNAFLTEFNPAGSALIYSTYLGGQRNPEPEWPRRLWRLRLLRCGWRGGAAYVVGAASSANFPVTKGALETTYHSQQNTGFIAKLDMGAAPTTKDTATALKPSANSVVPGTAVTFTATVTPVTGTAIPTGNVIFAIDEVNVATVALNGKGVATYSTSALPAGEHYVLASYAGNATYAASGGGFNEIITPVTPVIAPAAGTYMAQQTVTITSPTKTGVLLLHGRWLRTLQVLEPIYGAYHGQLLKDDPRHRRGRQRCGQPGGHGRLQDRGFALGAGRASYRHQHPPGHAQRLREHPGTDRFLHLQVRNQPYRTDHQYHEYGPGRLHNPGAGQRETHRSEG